ncbi:MAG: DUF4058 family protein, partial [Planctomycetaceae bacterium]|nr:DUF4058 family protein [Planctomycetaceae bacterium]
EEPRATIEIPLLTGDPAILLDLQAAFDRCYDAGPYSRKIDYGKAELIPPLQPERAAWLRALLSESN